MPDVTITQHHRRGFLYGFTACALMVASAIAGSFATKLFNESRMMAGCPEGTNRAAWILNADGELLRRCMTKKGE